MPHQRTHPRRASGLLRQHGVVGEAWWPLSGVDEATRAQLTEIGERYGKTWAQVTLRYQVQRGVIVIPKSHNSERQAANINLFDFELSDDEMLLIAKL